MSRRQSSPRTAGEPPEPPARPGLADEPSRFMLLEREVEQEYRPQMLAALQRYGCSPCRQQSRPLLDLLGVEPGRICGSLVRLLALLAVVGPFELAGMQVRTTRRSLRICPIPNEASAAGSSCRVLTRFRDFG